MPMRVIGMLLGIPEDRQRQITDHGEETLQGKTVDALATGEVFGEFIDWRAEHPSDDIMTDLVNAEFEDETGTVRKLRRDELLLYLTVIATAGSETTTRLIGWAGKTLADYPDQRRDMVENPALIPQAIEEILRWEPPALQIARYVTRDVEYYGETVPEGSAMLMLVGAANRDHRRFAPDGDIFDIYREQHLHMTFGAGTHFCRQRAGPAGRTNRDGGDPQTLPGLGSRLAQRCTVGDRRGPRLGHHAHIRLLTPNTEYEEGWGGVVWRGGGGGGWGLAETAIGLFKTEAIGHGNPLLCGPLRTLDDVECTTMERVNASTPGVPAGDVSNMKSASNSERCTPSSTYGRAVGAAGLCALARATVATMVPTRQGA